ncbi:MAG: flagellar motor protein MotB [Oscillospiraceae bacterium]|nr:flagellar motor protein MotB [Oscillospiraceae bacterium]
MAKKPREEEQCGNWMDTYGDMVTLLLTFFIMLFSMSSINEEKFAILVKAFTSKDPDSINIILDQSKDIEGMENAVNRAEESLGDMTLEELQEEVPSSFDDLYEYLSQYVAKSGMEGSVQIYRAGDGCVFIRFADNIFFNPDSSYLKSQSEPLLNFLGNCLKSVEDEIMTININGHTADPKIKDYGVSDWKLSAERASNVAIFFEERKAIKPQLLLPIGYGKNFPVDTNDTPEGRERNRRVDMAIISAKANISDSALLQSILTGTFDPLQYPNNGGVEDLLRPGAFQDGVDSGEAEFNESENPEINVDEQQAEQQTGEQPPASFEQVVQPDDGVERPKVLQPNEEITTANEQEVTE